VALSVLLPVFDLSLIDRSVFVDNLSLDEYSVDKVALIGSFSRSDLESSFSCPLAIHEFSLINVSIGLGESSRASHLSLQPVSLILLFAIVELLGALSVGNILVEVSKVNGTFLLVKETALSMVFVVLPVSVIDVTTVVIEYPFAIVHLVESESSVDIAVGVSELTQSFVFGDVVTQSSQYYNKMGNLPLASVHEVGVLDIRQRVVPNVLPASQVEVFEVLKFVHVQQRFSGVILQSARNKARSWQV
jgi:hypothetical protein